jgi:DNA-binding MarR family transcriptional regulator
MWGEDMSKDAAMAAVHFPRRSFELGKYLPFRLTVLSNRLTRRVAHFYAERFKLSAPEWRTMAVLGQQGAMSANAVISQTTMDKVRVSRAVAKLLKTGFITREADPQDRRRAILDLTPAGQEVYRQIVPLVQEVESEMVSALSGPERAMLDNALAKIEAYLQKSGLAVAANADEEDDGEE